MKKTTYILFLLSILIAAKAQTYEIRGTIIDSETHFPLSFANVRVAGSTIGTAANVSGEYSLKLDAGEYDLITSYIGYDSDTLTVNLLSNLTINFALQPASVEFEEVTVTPGVNPAIAIIEKAIARKNERNEKLNSYIFNAYTKGKIRSTEEISSDGTSIGLGMGGADSTDLKITGIWENQSKGYFLKPDYYKEEIIARKQTANFPSTINVLTGGRIIQNFYSDDIQFFGRPIVSPIANNALSTYYYYIEEQLAINDNKVYQIYFSTIDDSDPGFYGRIFIADETYDLLQVDVHLNSAANPGGVFNIVNVFQQFVPYDNDIYMPIDYRLFVEGSFLGLIRFGFEINSILYDYKINPGLTSDDFGMLALKVQTDADRKDSTYWNMIQTIPKSYDEVTAYRRIDSLESVEKTFWDRFSLLSTTLNVTDNFYTSAPLGMYHFNRVEGHSLSFEMGLKDLFNQRFSTSVDFSYGFADKDFKKEIEARYLLGDYRTTEISFSAFDKTEILFNEADNYNKFTSTVTSLFGKYDFRDYFRTEGWNLGLSAEVFPILTLSAGIEQRNDFSLSNNSDYSFFSRDKIYDSNLSIYDADLSTVSLGFDFDFRKYIEDGLFRRRITGSSSYFTFGGNAKFSIGDNTLPLTDFQIYSMNFFSQINSFSSTSASLWIEGTLGSGTIPFQMLTALPGNIESSGKLKSFRTLRIGEYFGDQIVTAYLEYNFGDELWRVLNIPLLKDSQIMLTGYINSAYLNISDDSRSILPHNFKTFKTPFYESGFSLGHPLVPFRLEFTWKLNHRGSNNFVIGINTFIL